MGVLFTDAKYVEHETVLCRLVSQLVGHAIKADVSVQVEGAHDLFLVVVRLNKKKNEKNTRTVRYNNKKIVTRGIVFPAKER